MDAAIVSPLDASVHGLEETSKDMKNLNIWATKGVPESLNA